MKKYLALAMAAVLMVCALASCVAGDPGNIGDYTPEVDYLITENGTFYFEEAEGETAILVKYVGKATSGDHVEIPATFNDRTVTTIGEQAFYNLSALVEVTIPDSIIKIDDYAFARCTELTEIKLPAGLLEIGEGAFLECTKLEKVDLGKSLLTIGEKAFNGCTALPSLSVPASVTSIGEMAYTDCKGLESITFGSDATEIKAHAFENQDGTNLKDRFVLDGLTEGSKVLTYVNALSDNPVVEETEAVTE